MAQIKLDFRTFFNREGRTIITEYKKLITKGRGTEQDDAPDKVFPNGKPWLVNTGALRKDGFRFAASANRLIIFPSGAKHPGKGKSRPIFRQLFRWHNTANGRYSGVFHKLPVQSAFLDRFQEEASRQLMKKVGIELTRDI